MGKHLDRMPPAALKRFEERANKEFTGQIREFEIWNGHKIERVLRCYGGCGTAIKSLIPDAKAGVRQRKVEGTSTVIQEIHMVLAPSISYVTVGLQMDDGSLVLIPFCRVCKQKLKEEDLESLYVATLEASAHEDEELGIPKSHTMEYLKRMAKKKVIGRVAEG